MNLHLNKGKDILAAECFKPLPKLIAHIDEIIHSCTYPDFFLH